MDWRDLAGTLVKAGAPLIGGALLGPIGAVAGTAIGGVLASALGVEATPEAVNTAITTSDPAVVSTALASADAQWTSIAEQVKAEADLGKAQVTAIGATMQAELKDGTWYQRAWRPFLMFLWGATWPYQLWIVLASTDVTQRASILYALAAWNGMPAGIAGVYAWGRTKEKIADAIPTLPGPAGTVVKAVLKKIVGR